MTLFFCRKMAFLPKCSRGRIVVQRFHFSQISLNIANNTYCLDYGILRELLPVPGREPNDGVWKWFRYDLKKINQIQKSGED